MAPGSSLPIKPTTRAIFQDAEATNWLVFPVPGVQSSSNRLANWRPVPPLIPPLINESQP